jgi:stage II sporulation protein P
MKGLTEIIYQTKFYKISPTDLVEIVFVIFIVINFKFTSYIWIRFIDESLYPFITRRCKMKYKRKKHKNSLDFTSKKKIVLSSLIIIVFVSMLIPQKTMAYSEESKTNNSTLFVEIVDNVISTFKLAGRNDDTSISGLFSLNPLNIVKNEVSFLDNKNFREEFVKEEIVEKSKVVEQIVINPFNLNESDINKQESVVETVGNPEDNSKKKVLVYHSHTSEAYSTAETRKLDPNQNIVAVGDALTKELQKQGFTVIHDKTIHDMDYNKSYYKSRDTISKYYNKYGDFDFVIDMHRDAGPEKKHVVANIGGESIARLMFVTTTQDPRYKAHMTNIKDIFSIAEKLYPELFRERNLHTNLSGIKYYNQDLSDNAVLIEVGATTNTLQEAVNSMKYFARVLSEHINNRGKSN